MNDYHVCKFDFSDNTLCYQKGQYWEKWYLWNSPAGGFRVEVSDGKWPCGESVSHFMCIGDEYPLFRVIRNSVPSDAFVIASQYQEFGVQVLVLCQWNFNLCAKLEANAPAVLLMLAETLWGSANISGFLESFVKLRWSRKRDISRLLGIKGEVLTVLLKAHDPIFSVTPNARLLIKVASTRACSRKIKHLSSINLDIVVLVNRYPELLETSQSLFEWISKQPVLMDLQAYERVAQIIELRKLLRLNNPFPYHIDGADPDALFKIQLKLFDLASKQKIYLNNSYPPPPIPGCDLLEPVTDFGQLEAISQRFDNCSTVYHNRITSGLNYLYFTSRYFEEDVCVLLRKNFLRDEWEIDQIVSYQNSEAAPWVEEEVRQILM